MTLPPGNSRAVPAARICHGATAAAGDFDGGGDYQHCPRLVEHSDEPQRARYDGDHVHRDVAHPLSHAAAADDDGRGWPDDGTGGDGQFDVSIPTSVVIAGGTAGTNSSASNVPFPFRVGLGPSILMIVESSLSLGVGVFLIIAGSLMLRNSPSRGPAASNLRGAQSAIDRGRGPGNVLDLHVNDEQPWRNESARPEFDGIVIHERHDGALLQASMTAAAALLYPIALLIVLALRSNREYFAHLRASRG